MRNMQLRKRLRPKVHLHEGINQLRSSLIRSGANTQLDLRATFSHRGPRVRIFRCWAVFAACSAVWLLVSILIPPAMSGHDVFIFRDAGWNLASTGSFESAALPYMHDLTPRLYSHYTPLMPVLFAGYASVFPRNAYAGTIFNLLVGLLAAGISLRWVISRSSEAGPLGTVVSLAIAVFPVAFITFDRPEALGFILASVTIAAAAKAAPKARLVGLLASVTFLAHPFAAIIALIWASVLFLLQRQDDLWLSSWAFRRIAVVGLSTLAALLPIALLFYALDPTSLERFIAHSFGIKSGLGVAIASKSGSGFLLAFEKGITGAGFLPACIRLLAFVPTLGLTIWAILQRSKLRYTEWLPIATSIASIVGSVLLFPIQYNYITLLTILTPIALLIVSQPSGKLVFPGLAMLLFTVVMNLPGIGLGLIQRIEQRSSFEAARQQPLDLARKLPSTDAIVGIRGDSYDLFKPELRHFINLDNLEIGDHYGNLSAFVNCYDSYSGEDGVLRPLPEKLDPLEFRLIEPAPQHSWITIFGKRVMRAQWGYGCDLYLHTTV